jgi:hypothetical protein
MKGVDPKVSAGWSSRRGRISVADGIISLMTADYFLDWILDVWINDGDDSGRTYITCYLQLPTAMIKHLHTCATGTRRIYRNKPQHSHLSLIPPRQFRRNARYAALGTQKALAAARASS